MQAEKNESVRSIADVNFTGSSRFDNYQLMNQELNKYNDCQIRTSDNFNSFKYGSFDLCCDYSMPRRDITLALHRSSIMIISFHEITANQHYSNVVLQFQGISLMRCNITCSLGFFCSD